MAELIAYYGRPLREPALTPVDRGATLVRRAVLTPSKIHVFMTENSALSLLNVSSCAYLILFRQQISLEELEINLTHLNARQLIDKFLDAPLTDESVI